MAGKESAIGTKIEVSGEREYKEACKEVNATLRLLSAEMKLATAEFASNADSVEFLTAKQSSLQDTLEENAEKIRLAESALKNLKEAGRENTLEFTSMEIALTSAKTAMQNTQNQLNGVTKELDSAKTANENYTNTVNAIDKSLGTLGAELKMVAAQYDLDAKSTDAAANKKSVLTQILSEQENKVKALNTAYEKAVKESGELSDEAQTLKKALFETKTGVYETENEIEKLGRTEDAVKAKTSVFGDVLLANLASDAIKTGLSVIVDGIKEIGKASIETGMDFKSSVANLDAITGMTADESERIAAGVRDISKDTGMLIAEIVNNAKMVAEAGGDVNLTMEQLAHGTNLAMSTQSDMATTLDFVGSTMKTFRLEAEDTRATVDSIASVTTRANLELPQLAESYVNVGGAAATAKLDINDVNAMLIVLSENGSKGGAAGTALNGVLRNLSTPTEKAAGVLDDLNISLYDNTGASRDMMSIMGELERSLSGLSDEQRAHYESVIFDTVSLKAWNMIADEGVESVSELSKELSTSVDAFDGMGQAAGMVAKQSDNLRGDLNVLRATLTDLGIEFYEKMEKPLREAAETGTEVLTFLAENLDDISSATTVAAVGIGSYTLAVNANTIATNIATTATRVWSATLAANPVGLIIAALATLGVAFVSHISKVRNVTVEHQKLYKSIDDINQSMADSKAAYEEKNGAIESEIALSQKLADELFNLAGHENKNIYEKERLLALTDMLNEAMGETVISYDAENDALSRTRAEINSLVDARAEQARAAAAMERATEIAKEQLIAEEKLAEIQRQRAEAQRELNLARIDGTQSLLDLTVKTEGLKESEAELVAKIDALNVSFDNTVTVAASVKKATNDTTEAFDEQAAIVAVAAEAQKKALESLAEEYTSYADKATDMFDTLSTESKLSIEQMTANLIENQRIISEWADNIAILAERGIDEGLLEQLRQAGPESAGYVAKMVAASDAELEKLSSAFANGGEVAKKALATSLGANYDVVTAAENLVKSTSTTLSGLIAAAEQIGLDITAGLAQGISMGTFKAEMAGADLVDATAKAAKDKAKINSPSKLFRDEIGVMLPTGMALGVTDGTPKAVKAAEKMAKDTYNAAKIHIEDYRNSSDYLVSEEIKMWEYLGTVYTDISKQKVEVDKNITKLREQEAAEQQKIIDKMVDAEKRYQDALDSRAQSHINVSALFDKLAEKEAVGSYTLISNLRDQVAEMESWSKNLQTLAEKGIDEGLLAEFEKMGPAANAEISALAAMSEQGLSEYSSLWQKKTALARELAVNELAGMREDTNAEIQGLLSDLGEKIELPLNPIGENMMQSYVDSVNLIKPELLQYSFDTGTESVDEMAAGVKSNVSILEEFTNLANHIVETIASFGEDFINAGESSSNLFADGILKGGAAITSAMQSVVKSAISSALREMSAYGSGSSGSGGGAGGGATAGPSSYPSDYDPYAPVMEPTSGRYYDRYGKEVTEPISNTVNMSVIQNISGPLINYATQQREAAKQLKQFAREVVPS